MQDQPMEFDEHALREALAEWEINAASLAYTPVGFGDHHWTVLDDRARRWFVTVADLADKPHCGLGTAAAADGLRRAMDTAWALRERAGLDFVVAPRRSTGGQTVRRLGERHGLSVFPYLAGVSGQFGEELTAAARGPVVDLLAKLHRAAPPSAAPVQRPELSQRALLEQALAELGREWRSGPFAEPARELLAGHAGTVRAWLAEFDRRAGELAGRELVVTHGEPHPGNLLRLDDRHLLVDWDTAGLAVPERDLWLVAREPADFARYSEATGRAVDRSALELYRLRWDLEDVAAYLGWFRGSHDRTPDLEQGWAGLCGILAGRG